MTRSIVELYQEASEYRSDEYPFSLLPRRDEVVSQLKQGAAIDVILLGNDLPTAISAHLLALNGVRVVHLFPGSPECLGGGAATDILELVQSPTREFFAQLLVRRSQAKAFRRYAPHRFRPIKECTYTFHHTYSTIISPRYATLRAKVSQLGTIDDGAILSEARLGARREGAFVVPFLEVRFLETEVESGVKVVGVRDSATGETFEVKAGGVVIARGVTPPQSRLRNGMVHAAKPHGGGIFHFEASVTSEQGIGSNEVVVHEIAGEVAVAVAVSSARNKIHVAVGVRDSSEYFITLAIRELTNWYSGVRFLSWSENAPFSKGAELRHGGGGTILLSSSSPLQAFSQADKLALLYGRAAGRSDREIVLSGNLTNSGHIPTVRAGSISPIERFRAEAHAAGTSEVIIAQAIARWGDRVRYIGDFPNGYTPIALEDGVAFLRGELGLLVAADQVAHVADLHSSMLRCAVTSERDREQVQKIIDTLSGELQHARDGE